MSIEIDVRHVVRFFLLLFFLLPFFFFFGLLVEPEPPTVKPGSSRLRLPRSARRSRASEAPTGVSPRRVWRCQRTAARNPRATPGCRGSTPPCSTPAARLSSPWWTRPCWRASGNVTWRHGGHVTVRCVIKSSVSAVGWSYAHEGGIKPPGVSFFIAF